MTLQFAKPAWYKTTLGAKDKVSSKVYRAVFAIPEGQEAAFHSGQTVMMHVAADQNRAMSIASAPQDTKHIVLYHDVSPMGVGSKWMIDRSIGDTCELMLPLGRFIFHEENARPVVFLATGTGIAPFYSMIQDLIARGDTRSIALYFGVRHADEVFLRDELESLKNAHPNFVYTISVSQPPSDGSWTGKTGRITAHIFDELGDIASRDYYLCGGKAIVEDVRQQLIDHAVPSEQIFTELYY